MIIIKIAFLLFLHKYRQLLSYGANCTITKPFISFDLIVSFWNNEIYDKNMLATGSDVYKHEQTIHQGTLPNGCIAYRLHQSQSGRTPVPHFLILGPVQSWVSEI